LAISPPSDIVLDVARAVDPAGLETARLALEKRAMASGPAAAFPMPAAGAPTGASAAPRQSDKPAAEGKAFQRFEAVVLQNFLQNMMPKDSEAVFGSGLAGDMWKSELAQQLADVMASRGGIGIANRLLKERYAEGDKTRPLTGMSEGAHRAEADRQQMMSVALVHDIQRKIATPIGGDGGTKL
jgi:Rod binding domain-containing protein